MPQDAPAFAPLEPARADDLPAVAALMNLAYRGDGPEAGWTTEAGLVEGERTRAELLARDGADHPDAALLVVRGVEGGVTACVRLEPTGGGVWSLGSLAVAPALQTAGAGRRVLAAAEHWAAARGARSVRLAVVEGRDTLVAWYVRRGYRLTGAVEPFPETDGRFGRPLRANLRFVILEKALPE